VQDALIEQSGMTVEHETAGMTMKDSMSGRQASDMGMRV